MKLLKAAAVSAVLLTTGIQQSYSCSRVVYLGDSTTNHVMVGRTLDWRNPIPTNLYVYPRGVGKQSMPNGPMFKWVSKYATVLAVSYDGGVTEGMNEKGLVMNGLFCKDAVYKESLGPDDSTPVMSLAVLVSYFLDNFATVDEVDTWLAANEFNLFGKTFDGGTASKLHWALTDLSGETLLLEYMDGQLTTYKSREMQVLTNDPPMKQMQAIEGYWDKIGGVNMLPGTVRSSDRFIRASFFIRHVPTGADHMSAFASLSSIMGNVAVPYGYAIDGEPNVSSTQWRSIADATGGKYYFKFACSTSDFWIDMNKLRLDAGAPILRLDTGDYTRLSGCVNDSLELSDGFTPMW